MVPVRRWESTKRFDQSNKEFKRLSPIHQRNFIQKLLLDEISDDTELGIVSKEQPTCYDLGILLDHYDISVNDIHDREIIYPKILEEKGWKIYRLCELNWNNNPQREIRQIIRKLQK